MARHHVERGRAERGRANRIRAARNEGGRRRLDSSVPDEYDVPTRVPRIASPELAYTVMSAIAAVWLVATVGAATSVVAVDVPRWVARPCAAVLMVVFAVALAHRVGGHMRLWVPPVIVLALAAAASGSQALLASSATVTAVVSAVWAVVVTRPAATVIQALWEYGIALLAALSGTVAVAAWNVEVNYQRFSLVVIATALGVAVALVWSLGAGLHGLGRQNFMILIGIVVLLLILLAYSSFVRTHGSQSLVNWFTDLVVWSRETFRGVPRPVEVFLGFPALVVGVSMRSKRREGWWVLVFAVVGTAVLTTSLVTPGAFPTYISLSTLYSIVLGGLLGLLIRSQVIQESSSRRARQFEEEHRVEPGRFAPLR